MIYKANRCLSLRAAFKIAEVKFLLVSASSGTLLAAGGTGPGEPTTRIDMLIAA